MGALQVLSLVGYRAELFVLEALRRRRCRRHLLDCESGCGVDVADRGRHRDGDHGAGRPRYEEDAVALIRRSLMRASSTRSRRSCRRRNGAVRDPLRPWRRVPRCADAALLLLPGAVAYAPVQILVVYLSVRRGRPKLSLVAGVVAMVVTIAASVPLIKAWGPSGAAAASAIGYACGAAVAWVLFLRLSRARLPA